MATPLTIHNKNNFIVPPTQNDKEVFVRDVNGKQTCSINPLHVVFMMIDGVNILVKSLANNNPVAIDFSTNQEAIDAMVILKKALDEVFNNIERAKPMGSFYHHIQLTASNTWTFMHGLERRTKVTLTDISQTEEMVGLVRYVSDNSVVINFNQPVSGHAWI